MRVLHTIGNCSDIKLGIASLGRGVHSLILCAVFADAWKLRFGV